MALVGLIVNPAAGRDIRRLTGGASVSDNYAKRRSAESVLEGLTIVDDPPGALVMPDKAGIGQDAVETAPEGIDAGVLDVPVSGERTDTRRAAERFRDAVDVVVVLGGDGTNRDVAATIGPVPVAAVSTGTNNVVPTPIDGTTAGAAAALVAAGEVRAEEVTVSHGTVAATVESSAGTERLRGLATLGVVDRSFVGTRAVLDASEFIGGVVSRAHPSEIGLSGVAGALVAHEPDEAGGVGVRLGPAESTPRRVRAMTVPGGVDVVGVEAWNPLDDEEELRFDVEDAVLSVDGERHLALQDAHVAVRPVSEGPRILRFDAVFDAVRGRRCFDVGE
ncbi:NAD(+)/NADH kinase [Halorubrum sp. AD140]|uniref:NAD(+)/NADH kinase n=1 Tax=Halorubrum sp. AD140 TaxID=3050073 RepID=UPI002ACC8650|nr:NAD(+)/NADH kinase [Halorubrum sp. AD140]MDZ5810755.1 NAD(+)/NADH kinase [Halorubrum sp. AD140]